MIIARSHPRIKNPFLMNLVYRRPATPKAKMTSKGIEYIIDNGVKLKFVHGNLMMEKMPIAVKQIVKVNRNFIRADFAVCLPLVVNMLYRLLSQIIPNAEKNST
jgi:hypothetical protein